MKGEDLEKNILAPFRLYTTLSTSNLHGMNVQCDVHNVLFTCKNIIFIVYTIYLPMTNASAICPCESYHGGRPEENITSSYN